MIRSEIMLRVPTDASWEFDRFALLQGTRLLVSDGIPVTLTSKAFDTLVLLVENRDRVVTKDELLGAVWPDVIVEEGNLTQQIFLIRKALGDTAQQPRYIVTVPGHGYRFTAPVKEIAPLSVSNPVPANVVTAHIDHRWPMGRVAFGVIGVVAAAMAGWWLLRPSPTTIAPAATRVVQLTALSGHEIGRLSPDGRQVLFEWTGEGLSNRDIYIQVVGSSDPHSLTTDLADDVAPKWSSDGRQIAYVRRGTNPFSGHIRVMSSLGSSDRKVSDFPVSVPAVWSPDDRYLVAGRASSLDAADPSNGLYLIPVQGGEPRIITRPAPPGADRSPTFSPDGRRLAYVSCAGPSIRAACHVNVLDVDATFAAIGSPRQVTQIPDTTILGLAWSSDGESLIYGAEDRSIDYLWRVRVDGQQSPERIEMAGSGAVFPSITRGSDRLVFSRLIDDDDIYRFEPGRPLQPVARSSVFDGSPEFSPNGQRMVFSSARAGEAVEVWIAGADGSAPAQLTHGPGRWQGAPAWSPDGLQIAFESQAQDGSWHIWTVDIESGIQHKVTAEPGDQNMPTWSRDGKWIYFSWKQGHARDFWQRDIWRTRPGKQSSEQITHGGGGYVGRESADAKTLLYQPAQRTSPLMAQPLAGGKPDTLIACVVSITVAVTASGIYYVPCSSGFAPGQTSVRVMDPVTRKDREFGTLEQYHVGSLRAGFAVSPDGKTILYSRTVISGADLMMLEKFR
jgi:Tol biopolymer transport system component/DNA-binding winged helix-turn-helix (wHTH) protein